MALPLSTVCLKSVQNKKLLSYRDDGFLQFYGENAMDSRSHFQVIPSTTFGNARYVHLLSRFSNKYLTRGSPDNEWISASVDEPKEDQSSWDCTLFEPISVLFDEDPLVMGTRLKHVQLGHYACSSTASATPSDCCLFAGSSNIDPHSSDIFIVTDCSSIDTLPTNVAFKGDNGKYLGALLYEGIPYLSFSYNNPNAKEVAQETTITSPNGPIIIKSTYFGKYWRVSENGLIVVDMDIPSFTNDSDMFEVNMVETGVVALRSLSNTLYCNRGTTSDEMKNLLEATSASIDSSSMLHFTNLD